MELFDSFVEYGVEMSKYTSMKVGGCASLFYTPDTEEGLISRAQAFHNAHAPYFLLGNGTNVIVRDDGYPGAVILTQNALRGIEIDSLEEGSSTHITCGAGESLAKVSRFAAEHGLSGLEALSGIPGTIGGAILMNAGAYESEISDVLFSVRAYDLDSSKYIMLTNEECELSYRDSIFKSRPLIVLSAVFSLVPCESATIAEKMAEYTKKRNEKQPVDKPSSGSFFKRPIGMFAGKLIEDAGMKGARVGGAQVSEKHAGFIINTGDATAEDVLLLSKAVKTKVFEKFQVKLEEEPIVIGI